MMSIRDDMTSMSTVEAIATAGGVGEVGGWAADGMAANVASLAACTYDSIMFGDVGESCRLEGCVWLLGKRYEMPKDGPAFQCDFYTRLWFTYRAGFTPIGCDYGPSSDAGWGCMLRAGQMMLAQSLLYLRLGREWRLTARSDTEVMYRRILSWFSDIPQSPFSIHRIASVGSKYGKRVGQWFAPTVMAQVMASLLAETLESGLRAHVAMDSMVFLDQLRSTLNGDIDSGEQGVSRWGKGAAPVLLLVPLRLGLDVLNPTYIPTLRRFFAMSQFVGIMGGRPHSAYFFVGTEQDNIIFLDPHTVSDVVDSVSEPAIFPTDSYHCSTVRKMRFTDMDPSMCLGFLLLNEDDLQALQNTLTEIDLTQANPAFTLTASEAALLSVSSHEITMYSDSGDDFDFEFV